MRKVEDFCVNCGLPCRGNACVYSNVTVYYCDECGKEAEYIIDGKDYCEDCAKEYLQESYDELTMIEKANALDINISKIIDY